MISTQFLWMKTLLCAFLLFLLTENKPWSFGDTQVATPNVWVDWHSRGADIKRTVQYPQPPLRLGMGRGIPLTFTGASPITPGDAPRNAPDRQYAQNGFAPTDGWLVQVQRRNLPDNQGDKSYVGLPDLTQFETHRSDRFLVDIQYISAGHPFKGRRALEPHQGAHIHWDNSRNPWPKGGVAVTNYPAIYAVADGYVDRIDYSFKVGTNDRYGVSLALATNRASVYSFCYGIEPMIPEPAPDFYRRYILVSEGQRVKKGEIIAYMYLAPGAGIGSHIHFHLQAHNGGAFLAPDIFTSEIVEGFHAHWNGFGRDGATWMPACLGYRLAADENAFENQAVEVLK